MKFLAKLGKLATFCNFLAGSFSAVSKRILQENMRLTAFFTLYKICILLHRFNLKIFAKYRFEKSAIFVKIQKSAKFCKLCRKICKIVKDMNYNFFYSTDLKKPQKTSEILRNPQKTSEILRNPQNSEKSHRCICIFHNFKLSKIVKNKI